jgi:hypothetical protein
MKRAIVLIFLILSKVAFSQEPYMNCSAVFLNDEMIVEEYTDVAKCKISKEAKGIISAGTVSLGDEKAGGKRFEITQKFEFGVAIKDGNTGTIIMYSQKKYTKIEAEKILAKCRKGDSILIMTTDDQYALPHNFLMVY